MPAFACSLNFPPSIPLYPLKIQAAERKERKESKNTKRMGEDGIGDDDLQVVSGERDLENLHPKERAKLEKKRGLIRAGMGAAADEAEDTGFEVTKASGAAMAMLGKRYKPKFGVDGLDVQDDREYGSDQVRALIGLPSIVRVSFA